MNNSDYSRAARSGYSAKAAKIMGNSDNLVLVAVTDTDFQNYVQNQIKQSEATPKMKAFEQQRLDVMNQRKSLYENLVAQGKPPVEIMKGIFEFNISLPDSDGFDQTNTRPSGYYRSMQQQSLDRLNADIKNNFEASHPASLLPKRKR